jgi:hypothetical protein
LNWCNLGIMKIQKLSIRNKYAIKNINPGFEAVLKTSLPRAKEGKTLKLRVRRENSDKFDEISLNGHQIKIVQQIFAKENLLLKHPESIN